MAHINYFIYSITRVPIKDVNLINYNEVGFIGYTIGSWLCQRSEGMIPTAQNGFGIGWMAALSDAGSCHYCRMCDRGISTGMSSRL